MYLVQRLSHNMILCPVDGRAADNILGLRYLWKTRRGGGLCCHIGGEMLGRIDSSLVVSSLCLEAWHAHVAAQAGKGRGEDMIEGVM